MNAEPNAEPSADRTADLLARLRADLQRARFTVAALEALWGTDAAAALHRGERVPARRELETRRAQRGTSADLATLAELFVLGLPVPAGDVAKALPDLGVAAAIELGLVARHGTSVVASLDLRPYAFTDARGSGEWWIISDLGELAIGGALGEQHVLGVGGASTTLAGLMLPTAARSVLDLGTGCGIQAMHASRFAERVVATDISERALSLAGMNLELNGIDGRRAAPREPLSNPSRVSGSTASSRIRRSSSRRAPPGCPSTTTATAAWSATRSSSP